MLKVNLRENVKITAGGWFGGFLETQLKGLTGHIEKAGYPFDTVKWDADDYISNNENPGWWVYEQTAYHLDGKIRCSIALNDEKRISEVSETIYKVIAKADEDGYLGPKFLKNTSGWNRWPHVVFFRACMALYRYNKDDMIIKAIMRHYLNDKEDLSLYRDVLNVEIMLLLFDVTGDVRILKKAEKTYSDYNLRCKDDLCDRVALSDKKPYAHGVSYNEYSKLGALLYLYTNKKEYLDSSVKAFVKIDEYFMLPGGCNCSNEFLIGSDYMLSQETCDVSDYTWALHYLLLATKDPVYADKIEKCVFNGGIGAVLENFKGLQYFSCANQLIADENSNHNTFFKGSEWMSYRTNPGTECCAGNVNRFMPNYILNSWHMEGNSVYSLLYADSEFSFESENKKVRIIEKTNYPAEEKISFEIHAETEFLLYLRIPCWASDHSISVNGKRISGQEKGQYFPVKITSDCQIDVLFTSEIKEHITSGKIYLSKGCIVYSYGMKGDRKIIKSKGEGFNDYSIYPDKEWRYALIQGDYEYKECGDFSEWDICGNLPYISVKAKKIKNWDLEEKEVVRRCYNLYDKCYKVVRKHCVFTPRLLSNGKLETEKKVVNIKLYPYGACKLRLTVFNLIKKHN